MVMLTRANIKPLTRTCLFRAPSMPTIQDRRQTRAGRFYEIDGHSYPSVTTILQIINKPALLNWMAKAERDMVLTVSAQLYEDVAETPRMTQEAWRATMESRLGIVKAGHKQAAKAAEIGSQVHALVEWNLHKEMGHKVGPEPKVADKALWGFMAWEDWRKSVDLKPLFIEQVVYSERHGYAGTLDLIAEVSGKLAVIDWKTGKSIYEEAHLQNAAYRQAVREMGHGDPVQGLIVRLPKVDTDPEFEVVEALDEKESFEAFLNFLRGWTWAQKRQQEWEQKRCQAVASA